MHLFGLTFVLFLLKLSAGNGFWKNIRSADEQAYKVAVTFERLNKKLLSAELALRFLYRCRDKDLHPKFTRWKNLNKKDERTRHHCYRRILFDEIRHKIDLVERLKNETTVAEGYLSQIPRMKKMIIKHAIRNYVKREEKKIHDRLEKKFQNLLAEKQMKNGIQPNPNKLVLNLTGVELTNEQYSALQFGLKHGIATRPRESDLIASAESVWEQLTRNNLLKSNFLSIERARNALRAFTFNILDFDDKRVAQDNKRIKIIKHLQSSSVILKPDKGEGVVLISKQDYTQAMDSLFSDRTKFKPVKTDPTHRRLISIQRYLRTLVILGELDKETYKNIRPKNAKAARAHGLLKIHKAFDRLPKFRPIIDTTGTTHYSVGKFLSELLQPLTQNEYTLKDTFDAANRIKAISPALFTEGYEFVSFDVESLFTNVPLQRTLRIIEDRIYNKKLVKKKA